MSARAVKEIDFGFFWCRVIYFYAMTPAQVGELPLKTFWLMVENIDRILAQSDMRSLTVMCGANSDGNGARQIRERLEKEKGEIVVVNEQLTRLYEKLDGRGLDDLRSIQ